MHTTVHLLVRKDRINKSGRVPIFIRFTKQRKNSYSKIGEVFEDEWNFLKNEHTNRSRGRFYRKEFIKAEDSAYLGDEKGWGVEMIKNHFSGNLQKTDFGLAEFASLLQQEKAAAGRSGTAMNYTTFINRFLSLYPKDVLISKLTYTHLLKFRDDLSEVAANTQFTYLSIARTVYYEAMQRDCDAPARNPFVKKLFPTKVKTEKRNVSEAIVRKLECLDLRGFKFKKSIYPQLALDLFLLGFYMRGMDIVDLLNIRYSEIDNGYYSYVRQKIAHKGGRAMKVKVFPQAYKILKAYHEQNGDLVFGVNSVEDRKRYLAYLYSVNKYLRRIGEGIEAEVKLTTKVNRHTFATIAKNKGVPFLYIQELLGHSLNSVTEVYVDVFPQGEIDDWHWKVISNANS